jgi:hypothetical protein
MSTDLEKLRKEFNKFKEETVFNIERIDSKDKE